MYDPCCLSGHSMSGCSESHTKGSLRQIKIRKLTVKIAMARCLNTIISVHEIDIIQVELHNIILGIFLFKRHRYEHFLDFSLPVLVRIQINISGELHRDGAATLGNSLIFIIDFAARTIAFRSTPLCL